MTGALLEAVDVVKQLGSGAGAVQALKGVNLLLTGGQMTMLMGPSGSGKTTLLCVLGCMSDSDQRNGSRPGPIHRGRRA